MRQKGGTMYREDVCVPFIIVHPEIRGGRTTTALASSMDIAPTLLSLAGMGAEQRKQRHPELRGHDLSPVVANASARTARDQAGILFNYAVRYGWNAPDVAPGVEVVEPLPAPDLRLRRLFRGVHDGRYKFARYFAPAEHHTPLNWRQLTEHNDLELYDTANDPDEIHNLAANPTKHRDTILRLNGMVNALVVAEVGTDDGSEYPGETAQYNTLRLR
jgi:arylsulfatase